MEETTTALVIGWKLAAALVVGSSILTTFGVYLLARFTKVFDAYTGERAKLLAQFHNLDKLTEQTQRLTTTTEAIRSRMTDEVWDRQQRWKSKLEFYQSLFRVVSDVNENTYQLMWSEALVGDKPLDHISWHLHPTEKDQLLTDALAKRNVELRHLLMFGELVAGERGCKCLEHLGECVKFHREDIDSGEPMAQRHYDRLREMIPKAIAEAKADLGYDPLPQSSLAARG